MYKQIGNKVAYYRKLRNLTQDELADRVNISVSSLSKLERGKYNNNIPLSMLIMIAEGLRIDVSMLVTFDEREKFRLYNECCGLEKSRQQHSFFCIEKDMANFCKNINRPKQIFLRRNFHVQYEFYHIYNAITK